MTAVKFTREGLADGAAVFTAEGRGEKFAGELQVTMSQGAYELLGGPAAVNVEPVLFLQQPPPQP